MFPMALPSLRGSFPFRPFCPNHTRVMLHLLNAPHRHASEVRKSRFLAIAEPISDEGAIAGLLRTHADPGASHLCWAWRIGSLYRFHDAGEPAGTAGRPILSAIDAQGVDQVLVVVLRWFGGIKLGAGGLQRAYGGCAAQCLREAEKRAAVAYAECAVTCDFSHIGVIHALLGQHFAEKIGENYSATGVRLVLRLPLDAIGALAEAIRDATRGQAQFEAPSQRDTFIA